MTVDLLSLDASAQKRKRHRRRVAAFDALMRKVLERAQHRRQLAEPTVFFLDEIHRFNKAQQDALLPAVESGLITLIGATTENPYFEVNSALLSRTRVMRLEPLSDTHVTTIVRRALADAPLDAFAAELRAFRSFDQANMRFGLVGSTSILLGSDSARVSVWAFAFAALLPLAVIVIAKVAVVVSNAIQRENARGKRSNRTAPANVM